MRAVDWEPYSLTYRRPTLPFLHAKVTHADLIESILLGLADEHRSVRLDSEADEALALVAWMHVAAASAATGHGTTARLGPRRPGARPR